MDSKQQEMLSFEASWYSLGGGSSQRIVEEFGLSDRDFFTEVSRLIDDEPPSTLRASELRRMRQVVRHRLWMAR